MKLKRSARRWSMLSVVPVERLSRQTTSWPRARRDSERWDPMKPAPPVTRMRMDPRRRRSGRVDRLASDRVVLEPQSAHALRLVDVAPVEDERPPHARTEPLQVEELELVPLRARPNGARALALPV